MQKDHKTYPNIALIDFIDAIGLSIGKEEVFGKTSYQEVKDHYLGEQNVHPVQDIDYDALLRNSLQQARKSIPPFFDDKRLTKSSNLLLGCIRSINIEKELGDQKWNEMKQIVKEFLEPNPQGYRNKTVDDCIEYTQNIIENIITVFMKELTQPIQGPALSAYGSINLVNRGIVTRASFKALAQEKEDIVLEFLKGDIIDELIKQKIIGKTGQRTTKSYDAFKFSLYGNDYPTVRRKFALHAVKSKKRCWNIINNSIGKNKKSLLAIKVGAWFDIMEKSGYIKPRKGLFKVVNFNVTCFKKTEENEFLSEILKRFSRAGLCQNLTMGLKTHLEKEFPKIFYKSVRQFSRQYAKHYTLLPSNFIFEIKSKADFFSCVKLLDNYYYRYLKNQATRHYMQLSYTKSDLLLLIGNMEKLNTSKSLVHFKFISGIATLFLAITSTGLRSDIVYFLGDLGYQGDKPSHIPMCDYRVFYNEVKEVIQKTSINDSTIGNILLDLLENKPIDNINALSDVPNKEQIVDRLLPFCLLLFCTEWARAPSALALNLFGLQLMIDHDMPFEELIANAYETSITHKFKQQSRNVNSKNPTAGGGKLPCSMYFSDKKTSRGLTGVVGASRINRIRASKALLGNSVFSNNITFPPSNNTDPVVNEVNSRKLQLLSLWTEKNGYNTLTEEEQKQAVVNEITAFVMPNPKSS